MSRIRTIKPEFWTSVQIVECSPTARLLFVGLWNFCDDGGNHSANPRTLKMEIFPGDLFTVEEISGWMEELICQGLVAEYSAEGKKYWHVTGWSKHQKVEKPSFKHPKFDEYSASIRRGIGDGSPPEGSLKEGNVVSTEDVDTTSCFREEKLVDACGKVDNSTETPDKSLMEAQKRLVDKRQNLENRGEDEKQGLVKTREPSTVLPFPPVNSGVG